MTAREIAVLAVTHAARLREEWARQTRMCQMPLNEDEAWPDRASRCEREAAELRAIAEEISQKATKGTKR